MPQGGWLGRRRGPGVMLERLMSSAPELLADASSGESIRIPRVLVSVCREPERAVAGMIATCGWIAGGSREGDKRPRNRRHQHRGYTTMGTAVRPAKTSPGPWDAFADVDVFVDKVLAELTAMARDGTRSQRSGPKPPLARAPYKQTLNRHHVR